MNALLCNPETSINVWTYYYKQQRLDKKAAKNCLFYTKMQLFLYVMVVCC